ncbi:MAG: flavodoxin family protein [Halanaeroarchaeum sp.]
MNTLVVYYSRTGTTRRLARRLFQHLADPDLLRIRPRRERRYPEWLALSCLPNATVDIQPVPSDLRAYDAVFLGSPKWTLSCPPVNAFLDRVDLRGVPVGVFITYGGFDERRFARSLTKTVRERGGTIPARLLVQRDQVRKRGHRKRIERFIDLVLSGQE